MRHRKPDILLVLTLSVGLGVLVTGYAQKLLYGEPPLVIEKQILDKKVGSYQAKSGMAGAGVAGGRDKDHRTPN